MTPKSDENSVNGAHSNTEDVSDADFQGKTKFAANYVISKSIF